MGEILRHGLASRAFLIGGTITLAMLALALVSLVWTPYGVADVNVAARLQGPSMAHWLGTDHFGRDLLSRIMAGAFNSLVIAIFAVALGAGLGVPLGALAATRGGWVDEAVMRLGDFTFAFPALLTAVMLTALYGPGAFNSIVAIGVFNIPVFARLTRGAAMGVLLREFVLAARAAGKGGVRITVEHVLPNIAPTLIVQMTIQFALAILIDAGLSYLGLGLQPPAPSLGKMLAEAQTMMFLAPRLAIVPGLVIVLAVLGLNLLGDGLRDVLDPRLRRAR
ncbi:ABC transporter permease [Futiania mangrovi]|uniref:ABC transporter permease n=1 Tax=Futiania mangrovi TaxID=2959716 RepID=A0A9J6PM39_9PROT|nr:ABC transporter permease [Futiania mangrovii]MCP1337727.1 ABC transporter permease [Futiania mangrovii]